MPIRPRDDINKERAEFERREHERDLKETEERHRRELEKIQEASDKRQEASDRKMEEFERLLRENKEGKSQDSQTAMVLKSMELMMKQNEGNQHQQIEAMKLQTQTMADSLKAQASAQAEMYKSMTVNSQESAKAVAEASKGNVELLTEMLKTKNEGAAESKSEMMGLIREGMEMGRGLGEEGPQVWVREVGQAVANVFEAAKTSAAEKGQKFDAEEMRQKVTEAVQKQIGQRGDRAELIKAAEAERQEREHALNEVSRLTAALNKATAMQAASAQPGAAMPQVNTPGGQAVIVPPQVVPQESKKEEAHVEHEGEPLTPDEIMDAVLGEIEKLPEQAEWPSLAEEDLPPRILKEVAAVTSKEGFIEVIRPHVAKEKVDRLMEIVVADLDAAMWLETNATLLVIQARRQMKSIDVEIAKEEQQPPPQPQPQSQSVAVAEEPLEPEFPDDEIS